MRKLSSVERGGLFLSFIVVLGGVWLALFPKEAVGSIPANESYRDVSYILKVSKRECRMYGVLAIGGGLALGALAVYPLKK